MRFSKYSLRIFLLLPVCARCQNQTDWTEYVNPFIGTSGTVPGTSYNGGNVFPGATLPFGVTKVGIDTTVFNLSIDANAGYTPDGNVTAISMLHESGTGGSVKYGVVAQMPLSSLANVNVLDNLTYMQPRTTNDSASIGYYKTSLLNGVVAEMSASRHAGIMQYSYPSSGGKFVLVDVSHYLPTSSGGAYEQFYSNGQINLAKNGQKYTGYGIWRGGWNAGPDYQVYFCGSFDTPPSNADIFYGPYTDPYWPNNTGVTPTRVNGSTTITGGATGYDYANRIGVLFEFPSNSSTVVSKVGVSWISVDKACSFVQEEIPSWDLNDTVAAAKREWNEDVFNKVAVSDLSNRTRLEMLYSSLRNSHMLPSDRTGENPNWVSNEPYYDDFYTLWDTFRCLNSLYLLIEPDRAAGIISSNYNGRVQGGSNADNVLADAFVKNLQLGINYTDAYAAMVTDAEVIPYNTFDQDDLTQSTKEGRGALSDWLQYGYITPNYGRSISKTVEYSLNDFALSQVARNISPQTYPTYLARSRNWQNLWSPNTTSLNYTGFLAPRYPNGTTVPDYTPLDCGECEWSALTYEALPWEYTWSIPFDMATLITLMGGPNTTESRLDTMFIPGLRTTSVGSGGSNGIGTTLFNPGNEPSFLTPFLYNYLPRRQHKSVLRARQTINTYYTTSPSGLPGNSDAGALDSWLLWNFLGLYPVVTQPIYLLLSPWFSNISIAVPGGNNNLNASSARLRITAEGLGDESFYVQSVSVNGVAWNRSWIEHEDIAGGGEIHFVLGGEPVGWDVGMGPPSPGT
ncbi:MAG: hypothetical protein M1834_007522 [Cirrosporium novae-zelandiae]|nr:MAG: hypothetical protein M1834_007522 [Cirrosporium novae-zelandiae]